MFLVSFVTYSIIFISGLLIGSFLNLVSDRLQSGKTIVFGKSMCDFCKKELGPKELIPLLSFVFQKGKCAHCNAKLSLYYPFSEILTGLLFLLFALWLNLPYNFTYSTWVAFFFYALLSSFLVIILLSDLKFMIIPDKVVIPAIIFVSLSSFSSWIFYSYELYKNLNSYDFGKYLIKAGFLKYHALLTFKSIGFNFVGAFGIALFFLLLIFITKGRGMGGGDVKLGFLIGLINGFPNAVISIFLGFFIGALYSIVLLFLRRKKFGEVIAFGPFLILGSVISIFFGSAIFEWYVHLL